MYLDPSCAVFENHISASIFINHISTKRKKHNQQLTMPLQQWTFNQPAATVPCLQIHLHPGCILYSSFGFFFAGNAWNPLGTLESQFLPLRLTPLTYIQPKLQFNFILWTKAHNRGRCAHNSKAPRVQQLFCVWFEIKRKDCFNYFFSIQKSSYDSSLERFCPNGQKLSPLIVDCHKTCEPNSSEILISKTILNESKSKNQFKKLN